MKYMYVFTTLIVCFFTYWKILHLRICNISDYFCLMLLCSISQSKYATIFHLVIIKFLRCLTAKQMKPCFARLQSLTKLNQNTISQNHGISLSRTCNWRKKIGYFFHLTTLPPNLLCRKIKSAETNQSTPSFLSMIKILFEFYFYFYFDIQWLDPINSVSLLCYCVHR
jgi:hypothetical protein